MTQESGQTADVLVIGAGMAGLTAAAGLQRAGCRVLVLDKGRGVGGRLASRRIGGAAFDHGAQFITARTSRFAALLEDGRRAGAVEEWHRGAGDGSDAHVRWRGHPAMTSVAKHLARGIELILETRVVALRASRQHWSAETGTGAVFSAGAVVLTPPVPQSLAILKAGAVPLQPETRARLEGIEYERCLTVMAVLAGPSRLAPPGCLAPGDGPIAWIADNQLKGISAEPAVTLHATHAFSLEHWERDRQDSGRRLLDAANGWLGADVRAFQVHGWLYSKPLQVDDPVERTTVMMKPLDHERFMRRAIALTANCPRLPFGALIVRGDTAEVVAEGWNKSAINPTWHGEIDAINRLAESGRGDGGSGLVLYTTAEPCPMCLAAILWSGIGTVVFGSSIRFLQQQGWRQIDILADEVVRRSPGWTCTIIGGVLEQECNALFEGRAG